MQAAQHTIHDNLVWEIQTLDFAGFCLEQHPQIVGIPPQSHSFYIKSQVKGVLLWMNLFIFLGLWINCKIPSVIF